MGRFISEDPLGFGGGDVNLFAYARNDPINKIDPFGLQAGSDAIQGLPALWPAVATGAQFVGGAIIGVITSPVTVGAIVVGSVIHVTSGTIAEEPAIPPFPITQLDNPDCQSSDKKREKNCDNIYYNIDIPTCRGISRSRGKDAGARCYAQAAERYSACLAGRPMPPLNTWNN